MSFNRPSCSIVSVALFPMRVINMLQPSVAALPPWMKRKIFVYIHFQQTVMRIVIIIIVVIII